MGLIVTWEPEYEFLFHGADAQRVYEEIVSIGPSATPEQIVGKGRDERTELHRCFTWDDREAAEKWRKEEARSITHHLRIRKAVDADEKEPAPRVFVKTENNVGYRSIEFVVKNDDEYQQLLQRALGELLAFKKKYSILSERDELQSLINAVEAMITAA